MGNCLSLSTSSKTKALPIDTSFKLPSPLPSWPPGDGFGSGIIELGGGLQVCQVSSLNRVWATHEGGPDNLGASFFEPSQSQIPQGFVMLGCYAQPNNTLLYCWVLAAKDNVHETAAEGSSSSSSGAGAGAGAGEGASSSPSLARPTDYSLVWSSESLKIKQDGIGYIWLPTPPDGYKAVGHLVTTSPEKPSLDRIRCVRSDLTDQCETDSWIWGRGKQSDPNGFNVFSLRPANRGTQATGVSVGTFLAYNGGAGAGSRLACLKNINSNLFHGMPNLAQIQAIFQAYSPWVYFHPDEEYLPSSVSWYFLSGALLYKKGEEANPVPIDATGSNLPQGGSNDDAYWLDLPHDEAGKERVIKGNLQEAQAYLHVKPMMGGTFTDLAVWLFYPFNGPARAKVRLINVPLGRIGEHIGDWEHVTLRVSNFNGELRSVYMSEHSGGEWVSAPELEYQDGNKAVSYASLHGHAMYSKPGLVLQGGGGIGIRNDAAKSKMVMDTGAMFSVVAAEYLGAIEEPPWLNYYREWGPKIDYDITEEVKKVEKLLPGNLKSAFDKFIKSLPKEILGQEGPTGPKTKRNWYGDEV